MTRIPTLIIMPLVYLIVLVGAPFVVLLMLLEAAIYKLRGMRNGKS
jgi:hypothetical protein